MVPQRRGIESRIVREEDLDRFGEFEWPCLQGRLPITLTGGHMSEVSQRREPNTIILFTVNENETIAVHKTFKPLGGPRRNGLGTYWDLGLVNGWRIKHAQTGMGDQPAQAAASDAVADWPPHPVLLIGVGIAWGAKGPPHQKIGDVLVACPLFDAAIARAGIEWTPRGNGESPDDRLVRLVRSLAQERQSGSANRTVQLGKVLSRPELVDNAELKRTLLKACPEAIGGEMEARGILAAIKQIPHNSPRPNWLIIKAICDWGEGLQSRTRESKQTDQMRAAIQAAKFVRFFLEHFEDEHSCADWHAAPTRDNGTKRWDNALPAACQNAGKASSTRELAESFSSELTPQRPEMMFGRDGALHDLKIRLNILPHAPSAGSVQILTAMRGWPGIGKTTLASALANDPDIERAFPDGLLWASLGTKPDLSSHLARWARRLELGPSSQANDLTSLRLQVSNCLRNLRVLIIIDDVWEIEHGQTLKIGGLACATLITTRSLTVANALAPPDCIYVLDRMSSDAAMELLNRLAPNIAESYRDDCLRLIEALEGLPLALQVAGRMLHAEASNGWDVAKFLVDLQDAARMLPRLAPPNMLDLVSQTTPTIAALLKKSTDVLDIATRRRFAYLGAVREKPATFDVKLLQSLWQSAEVKETADILINRGLLEPVGSQRFTIHSLLLALANSMLAHLEEVR